MSSFFASLFYQQRLVTIASLGVVVALCAALMQWSGDRLMMIDFWTGAAFYSLLVFLMWWTMMMAMMLPTAVPALLVDAAIVRKFAPAQDRVLTQAAFALGYVAIWSAFALAATMVNIALGTVVQMTPMMAITSKIIGIVLLAMAGLYQLTPAKQNCLIKCQSPIAFRPGQWRAGAAAAFERGLRHGLYCTGCCGALMLLLFYGGVMEINWIGGLALYVLVEKLIPAHWRLAQFTGVLLLFWAGALAMSLWWAA